MSVPTQAAKKFSSFYRVAGLNYLQYLEVASTSLRRVLKEPQRSEALKGSHFKYREFVYEDGKELPPVEFYTDPSMAKK